jgi:hypothetical protein
MAWHFPGDILLGTKIPVDASLPEPIHVLSECVVKVVRV